MAAITPEGARQNLTRIDLRVEDLTPNLMTITDAALAELAQHQERLNQFISEQQIPDLQREVTALNEKLPQQRANLAESRGELTTLQQVVNNDRQTLEAHAQQVNQVTAHINHERAQLPLPFWQKCCIGAAAIAALGVAYWWKKPKKLETPNYEALKKEIESMVALLENSKKLVASSSVLIGLYYKFFPSEERTAIQNMDLETMRLNLENLLRQYERT